MVPQTSCSRSVLLSHRGKQISGPPLASHDLNDKGNMSLGWEGIFLKGICEHFPGSLPPGQQNLLRKYSENLSAPARAPVSGFLHQKGWDNLNVAPKPCRVAQDSKPQLNQAPV